MAPNKFDSVHDTMALGAPSKKALEREGQRRLHLEPADLYIEACCDAKSRFASSDVTVFEDTEDERLILSMLLDGKHGFFPYNSAVIDGRAQVSAATRAIYFIVTGQSGLSARAISRHMSGVRFSKSVFNHPLDGFDFARCHRLLTLVPEWRERISEMGSRSKSWEAIATSWDKMTQVFEFSCAVSEENGARAVTKFMQENGLFALREDVLNAPAEPAAEHDPDCWAPTPVTGWRASAFGRGVRQLISYLADLFPNHVFFGKDFLPKMNIVQADEAHASDGNTALIATAVAAGRSMEPGQTVTAEFTTLMDSGRDIGDFVLVVQRKR